MNRVLFFIPTLAGGGAEKVLVNLVNSLDKNKFDITVLVLFDNGTNKDFLNSHIKYDYIFRKSFKGVSQLLKLFSPQLLAKIFIKDKYNIIISYLQGATTRIVSGVTSPNVRKIQWIHGMAIEAGINKSYKSKDEFIECYSKYDSTIFVSQDVKKEFEDITGLSCNHFVIHNTLNTSEIIKKSDEQINDIIFDKNKINIIVVGSLIEVKGYARLLRVINQISQQFYNFHLYILGDGELRNEIEDYIQDNSLSKYVSLLGYKKNPYKYIKDADLLICASYSEGLSTAVTEALILGVAVITTDCPGMEDLLGTNGQFGLIVGNSEEELYIGLKDIMTDTNELAYYSKQAKKRSTFFSDRKTIEQVEILLMDGRQ